jgi:hypothetical protein
MVWLMSAGHVTAGGSICLEVLTNTGSGSGWKSDYSVESILRMIFHSMITCERVMVKTASGPGGMSGPLRIDLKAEWGNAVMSVGTLACFLKSFRN